MQKLIILSLVLLTTLSATLLTEMPVFTSKEELANPGLQNVLEKDNTRLKKLKHFNVKNYFNTYEEDKKERNIRIDSIKRLEYLKNKERQLIPVSLNKKSEISQIKE